MTQRYSLGSLAYASCKIDHLHTHALRDLYVLIVLLTYFFFVLSVVTLVSQTHSTTGLW